MTRLAEGGDWRHGYKIKRWLEVSRELRDVPLPSIYRVMKKLDTDGFLEHRLGDPKDSYAGPQRKYYRLNAKGMAELHLKRVPEMQSLVVRLQRSINDAMGGKNREQGVK